MCISVNVHACMCLFVVCSSVFLCVDVLMCVSVCVCVCTCAFVSVCLAMYV